MSAHNPRIWRVLPALAVVLSLLGPGIAVAGAPEGGPPSPAAPLGTEDGGLEILDVGAEYPSASVPPGMSGALPYTADSAWNFYNKMRDAGYTGPHSFIWGNAAAWESDWKRSALGGNENGWVDNVDIMFFHDHGGSGSMWFPWGANANAQNLVASECQGAWGDKDVEWIGIKSCLTLSDVVGFAACMNGVHLICGMVPVSYGANYGGDWADQLLGWKFLGIWLRSPKTVTQAWFSACDSNQPSSVVARCIAEEPGHFNDKVWTRGGPALGDVTPGWPRYYIDHTCYKPPPRPVDVDAIAGQEVNTYQVQDRQVTQQYAQGIANALGLQGEVQCPAGSTQCGLVANQGGQTLSLSIETATGGFVMQNLDQLWAGQDPGAPLTLPTEEAAVSLAGAYVDYLDAQALPGFGTANVDKSTAHYEQDKQTALTVATSAAGAAAVTQTGQGVDVLVAYGRTLATGVQAASGAAVNVGSVGPGSVTKLYYGGASSALRGPSQEQLPIGLAGGNRDVQTGASTIAKDYNIVWDEFLADRQLAVVNIPLDWDTAVRVDQTFSYYEQPLNVPQQELIPVWVFTADLYKGAELAADNATIYVPANADYYPPAVTIDEPADGSTILAGKWIDLKATASGGFEPFTYEWSSTTQGPLGDQEDISAFLLAGPVKPEQGGPVPVVVSLKVTNQNGQSRTEQVTVNVVGRPTWLPLVRR